MVATSPKKAKARPKPSHSSKNPLLVPATPKNKSARTNKKTGLDDQPQTPSPAKQKRQPSRCSKCPGRPLRSQCIHTKEGTVFVREQMAMQALREPTPVQISSEDQPTLGEGSSQAAPVDSSMETAPALRSQLPQSQDDIFSSSSLRQEFPAQQDSLNLASAVSSPGEQSRTDSMQGDALTEGVSTPSTATAALRTPSTRSTRSTASKAKQVRTSASNPYRGHVTGACRGEEPWHVVRGHALPPALEEPGKASRKFADTIGTIIERCEDLSHQTGCWLFLGAQHPTARLGAVNFASSRLRREAKDEAGQIASNFCRLTNQLLRVRANDTLKLVNELEESRKHVETIQQALASTQDSKLELEAKLERYKMMYGILE